MRAWVVCGGFGTRRPSSLESFCEKASRGPLSVLLSVYEVNRFYGSQCQIDQCRYRQGSDGGRKHRINVYDACSDYVVFLHQL